MRIIISPAKRMVVDKETYEVGGLPYFIHKTRRIKEHLKFMSPKELKILWRCNDSIAALNVDRLKKMNLEKGLTPAILSFQGLQYQHMAPRVFESSHLQYLSDHLRILSGFYGVLKPLDGVVPYRLEMQAKLKIEGRRDLYDFWGKELAEKTVEDAGILIDLASKEYSKSVTSHLPQDLSLVKCSFVVNEGERMVEKGTFCKMARGEMVRYMAENRINKVEGLKDFKALGYSYFPKRSTPSLLVFVKDHSSKGGEGYGW